ncbi:hypothetical protein L1987_30798 [Smallanthus sonchifolius]|uniref:Uncharacterized protein n=1 Tax=Smallanthus sonchifolius TaxID=185202 RepID=A0ACB9I362_9ASTR|nr:hypothetical protein L1987_30798 [Smallanthus sonchifolius]
MAEVVVSLETVLALQERFNSSLPPARRTIFGGMVNTLPSPSNGENSVQGDSKLSSNSKGSNMLPKMKEIPANHQIPISSVKEFSFEELKKATRDFSLDLLLGEGGLGQVFIGWVDQDTLAPSKQGDGMAVAVKRLHQESRQGYAEWVAEVNFLGQLAHPNVVKFFGYCRDEQEHEHLIVYEYMPNKTLDRFLFTDGIVQPLSWETRLSIMIGVIRGVIYLHSTKLIFRDLKSSRILLDEILNSLNVIGRLSMKSDIYCFGVMLLECITARKVMDVNRDDGQQSLVDWASSVQSNSTKLEKIMDPRLKHNYPLQDAFKCIALALRCVATKPKDRPSSEEVLHSLEKIYALNK